MSNTTACKVYGYAGEASSLTTGGNAAPTVVYTGDPTNGSLAGARFGDAIDVRGSGASTQILAGSRSSNVSAVLNATDATPEPTALALLAAGAAGLMARRRVSG